MPRFAETGYLITVGVIQAGLGLAIGVLLLSLYRLGRELHLAYWGVAWLILSALSVTGVLSLLLDVQRGPGLVLGLLSLLLLYVQPAALGLAAISLVRPKLGRATHWTLVGGLLACGFVLVLLGGTLDPARWWVRNLVIVSPPYLLTAIANGWFAWSFSRHAPRARTLAGRLVIGFSLLWAVHLLVIGIGWAGAELYRNPTVAAVVGLMLPMGITVGIVLSVLEGTAESAARLRESEATNRGLLEAIPDMLVVLDRDGVYRDYRPAKHFAPLVPPEFFLGKRADEFLPADLARAQEVHLRQLLETGETQVIEYSLPAPDGLSFFEARLAGGGDGRVIGIVRDVTARKHAEEERERLIGELAAEKERLAVTLRSIGDGVIATDVDGRITLLNRGGEQLTGWSAEEATGRPLPEVFRIVDRETRQPQPDPVAGVLARGAVLEVPSASLLLRKDGGELQIAQSAAPICDRRSHVVGVVLVFRDVGERRRVEEQLQNAQKLESLGILAGGIAHDFNNLLTGVFGFIDLARHRSPANAPIRDALENALGALARARGLTGQLLTFSRAGQPVKAPLALDSLLQASVRFALSGSNVGCRVEVPDDLWPCEGDERQIDQVIDNLLLNARQAMPDGGVIEVTAANVRVPEDLEIPVERGRYVRITVRDHGEGVPARVRSRIFEPFFTTKSSGSGLGLATAYSIVRKHDGHIELASKPGKGAAFSVYLPASSETPSAVPTGDTRVSGGHGRVLILEDEDHVREVATEMLDALGYTVEAVADGPAAVERCERAVGEGRPFDLAILDLTIPGGQGGVAVAPRLREIDPELPLLATSGYSGDPVMAEPDSYGFVATLAKPYTLAEVADVVAGSLRRERRDEPPKKRPD